MNDHFGRDYYSYLRSSLVKSLKVFQSINTFILLIEPITKYFKRTNCDSENCRSKQLSCRLYSSNHLYFVLQQKAIPILMSVCITDVSKIRLSFCEGEIATLQGVDCKKVGEFVTFIHYLWSSPMQILIAIGYNHCHLFC